MPSIRRALASDAAAVAELRWRLRTELREPSEDHDAFLERCARWFEAAWHSGDWITWLAEDEGEAQGMVTLGTLPKVPNPVGVPETIGYLTSFYVVPGARSRGLGSRLMGALLAEARRRDMAPIVLWPTQRSVPLYRRFGFERPNALLELERPPNSPEGDMDPAAEL